MSKNQRHEQLNEVQVAEIREIFTLFDKNSDGYVNTSELGNVIRALYMNPTQAEVKEMEREVDPNETGSFDQISLIGLIAKRPKVVEELEEMIQAIRTICPNPSDDNEENKNKIPIETLKFALTSQGEELQDHEVEEILADVQDLVHEDYIMIDTFANYLMSR